MCNIGKIHTYCREMLCHCHIACCAPCYQPRGRLAVDAEHCESTRKLLLHDVELADVHHWVADKIMKAFFTDTYSAAFAILLAWVTMRCMTSPWRKHLRTGSIQWPATATAADTTAPGAVLDTTCSCRVSAQMVTCSIWKCVTTLITTDSMYSIPSNASAMVLPDCRHLV